MLTKTLKIPPAKPGTCAVCDRFHDENTPHDFWSFFYQMCFWLKYGRDATHADATAHMTPEQILLWRTELADRGGPPWTAPPEGMAPVAEPYCVSK
jgi:hypothetical protein